MDMCHARSTLGRQGWEQFHQEEESQVTVLALQELLLLIRYLKGKATKLFMQFKVSVWFVR